MPTIREQIEPYLRAAGIKPTAEASGVNRVSLQHWLAGRRRLADTQIEAVCRVLRLKIKIGQGRRRPPGFPRTHAHPGEGGSSPESPRK